jgi:hypothetical protein
MSDHNARSHCVVKQIVSRPQSEPRFVVQVCVSAARIAPDAIPQLDIFDLYHLYCDVTHENGLPQHALRLGFFKEAGTAKAIARYLGSHFESPRVVEVGAAEIVQALRHRFVARKDIGASGQHAVIEIATPATPPSPAPSLVPPSKVEERSAPSLWSRLASKLNPSDKAA